MWKVTWTKRKCQQLHSELKAKRERGNGIKNANFRMLATIEDTKACEKQHWTGCSKVMDGLVCVNGRVRESCSGSVTIRYK